MANRPFVDGPKTLDTELRTLYGAVTFGATSTVTSQDCNGFTVTALGTGTFTVTCEDKYNSLIGFVMTPLAASATDTGWQVITSSPSTGVFTIRNAPGGAATAPATGLVLYIAITLRDSAAARKGV